MGHVDKTIELRQTVVTTEIVCTLRYQMNAIAASGINSESIAAEFAKHAQEEQTHMLWAAERIDHLGGISDMNPAGQATRSATEYGKPGNLVEMIKQNLIAERIAVEHYRELIRYFSDRDPTTRIMLEKTLAQEEEHATDMHDFLVAHEGTTFLQD